jgi:hypothetical protein
VWRGSRWGRLGAEGLSAGLQQRQVGKPGSDRVGVLPAHDSGNLAQVVEVVGDPGRQQLAQGDGTQLGVETPAREILRLEPERFKPVHVGVAQLGKGVEQLRQRSALGGLELGESVERLKGPGLAVDEEELDPGNPVRALTVDEMPHDIVGAPGVGPLVRGGPPIRDSPHPGPQNRRRLPENRKRVVESEFHRPDL